MLLAQTCGSGGLSVDVNYGAVKIDSFVGLRPQFLRETLDRFVDSQRLDSVCLSTEPYRLSPKVT